MRSVTKPLTRAGIFLGICLGGFIDGIVLHQLLQVHSMLTGRLPKNSVANIEITMFWDGVFHAFNWVMTLIGVILLFRVHRVPNVLWSGRAFTGSLFLGWGLFNGVEGIIDHHILHLHHVVERHGESIYDYLFLAVSLVFIIGGWLAIRSVRPSASAADERVRQ